MNGARLVRWLAGVSLVLAALLATGALTRLDYRPEAEQGAIQLAWRAPVTRVEECRTPTEEELAELPPHMRQDEICEGRALPYRLKVTVDGEVRHDRVVEPSGARGDRPLYVFERMVVDTGAHEIGIEFEIDVDIELEIEGRGAGTGWPRSLELRRRVEIAPGQVVLVTYDNASRRLTVADGS